MIKESKKSFHENKVSKTYFELLCYSTPGHVRPILNRRVIQNTLLFKSRHNEPTWNRNIKFKLDSVWFN